MIIKSLEPLTNVEIKEFRKNESKVVVASTDNTNFHPDYDSYPSDLKIHMINCNKLNFFDQFSDHDNTTRKYFDITKYWIDCDHPKLRDDKHLKCPKCIIN